MLRVCFCLLAATFDGAESATTRLPPCPLSRAKHSPHHHHHYYYTTHSDVACEYPLKAMFDDHVARKAEATILVTKVREGVVWCVWWESVLWLCVVCG